MSVFVTRHNVGGSQGRLDLDNPEASGWIKIKDSSSGVARAITEEEFAKASEMLVVAEVSDVTTRNQISVDSDRTHLVDIEKNRLTEARKICAILPITRKQMPLSANYIQLYTNIVQDNTAKEIKIFNQTNRVNASLDIFPQNCEAYIR